MPLGLLIGLLHDVEVQFKGGMPVQAEEILFSKQMAVGGRGGVGGGEQAAQQRQGVAQGGACSVGLTVRPQQGRQFAARVHATFDRQVEQQGLCLAQGKGQAAALMIYFGRAEHGQT